MGLTLFNIKDSIESEIHLTEMTVEDLTGHGIRFDLVTAAKMWDYAKQLSAVPTLLRGKLVDYYDKLSEEILANTQVLKTSLFVRAGLC